MTMQKALARTVFGEITNFLATKPLPMRKWFIAYNLAPFAIISGLLTRFFQLSSTRRRLVRTNYISNKFPDLACLTGAF
jgi:hypothetical protein